MKIAIVHDYLVQDGGAERVLQALCEIFPQAPVFTLVADKDSVKRFCPQKAVQTTFLQRFPLGVRRYQWWLPLMPAAIESHNLMGYDLVISSTSSFAKGVITAPGAKHVCYCHTPTRYLWNDSHNYVRELRANVIVKSLLPHTLKKLRVWDRLAVDRIDAFVANSRVVAERIKKYYGRDSTVIYPPVSTAKYRISSGEKKYYLAGGRLVPYKRIDLCVKAFSRLGMPLKVFGVGPEMRYLKKIAKPCVQFLGKVDEAAKTDLFANCLAYLNPQEEDFGLTAVEAMASGRPVIAYRRGGALETVVEGVTGEFFDEQIWEDLADRIMRFQPENYDPNIIRARALEYDEQKFKQNLLNFVRREMDYQL